MLGYASFRALQKYSLNTSLKFFSSRIGLFCSVQIYHLHLPSSGFLQSLHQHHQRGVFFSVAPTKVSTCVPIQANDQVLRAPFRPRRYSNTYHYTIQTQQTERRLSYIFFGIMRGFKVLACLVIAYANVSNFIVYYIITLPGQVSLPIAP